MAHYDYTVGKLLHEAQRHRRSDRCYCKGHGPHCRCEDDHVIELRLVTAALNRLPRGTYIDHGWQSRLVDFFNEKHRNFARAASTEDASGGQMACGWRQGFDDEFGD